MSGNPRDIDDFGRMKHNLWEENTIEHKLGAKSEKEIWRRCASVCVWKRERGREGRENVRECEREREREKEESERERGNENFLSRRGG